MLREALLSEYQIEITDVIPLYKVPSYPNWHEVDYILSTVDIHGELPKPYLLIHPILRASDHIAIEELGIPRKELLSNFFHFSERLNFLASDDQEKSWTSWLSSWVTRKLKNRYNLTNQLNML